MAELSIIQKTYDLVKWYVPIINRFPRDHKFLLGDRIIKQLYDLLEALIEARFADDKLTFLQPLNTKLDILRHQARLLLDFQLISSKRYEYVSQQLNTIGSELGGWIRHQQRQHDLA
jgi:hypothetical protein